MSRHRDVRKMDYDDYADEDDYDESYEDDSNEYDSRPTSAAIDVQSHHRAQLTGKQQTAPRQVAENQSSVFFKTKPAKKGKGGGVTAASSSPPTKNNNAAAASASTSSRPPPGFTAKPAAADDFDADTAAAIAASLADAQATDVFNREAGLTSSAASSPAIKKSAPIATPTKSSTPLRSQDATAETNRALAQLRLDKQRAAGLASGPSTPQRQLSGSPSHSPPTGSKMHLPVSSRPLTMSMSSGSIADDRHGGVPQPSSSPPPNSSSSSSSMQPQEIGDAPAPTVSAKRAKEVNAAVDAEASSNSSSGSADNKSRLNMVVIGHVDAGKSTLMGHLLFLQGRVSKKLMHKYEKESKELGKSSFHFAWVLDETDEERSRGITTDIAINYFETPNKKITLLDAPGHKEFIPNMITGAAQADAGILVIPATRGEFEAGFSEDGQIREHAVLARSLGVNQLILAVNKLDTVEYSQQRYNELVGIMIPYLKSVGYKEKDLWSLPVSGLVGENIMECKEPRLKSWYTGPVLLDLIDNFTIPKRETEKPVRICIQDVFKSLTLGGMSVSGKLETGTILIRDKLLILPLNETVTVKAIESGGENRNLVRAGENVELGLKDVSDVQVLQVGQWLCDPLYPIPIVTHFRAQIITMSYKIPLITGTQLTLFTQAATVACHIHSIQSIIDSNTGSVIKKSPRVLPRQSTAIVEFLTKERVCMELFRNYRELGRFTLRRGNESVAVGICVKLYRIH